MFFKKTENRDTDDLGASVRFKTIPPNIEERDLMRKLCDDLITVLDRHRNLCSDTHLPHTTSLIQITVLTHVFVHYFVQIYHSTKPIIPYMDTFLTHLNNVIRHQDHG